MLTRGVDNFPILVLDVDNESRCEKVDKAFDEEERENFPLDTADLVPGWAEEHMDIDEPTPRSDDAEFLSDEFDDDCRLLKIKQKK